MKKALLILSTIFCFGLFAQNNRLIIKNVTVIPLHINQQWKNKDVIYENGTIVSIRNHQPSDTNHYDLGKIDGKGKFLMSSFSDAHVHLPEKENLDVYFLMNLVNGVTTLRSMRGENWHLDIDKNAEFTPRLLLSSPPVRRKNEFDQPKWDSLFATYRAQEFDFVKVLSVSDEETFDRLVESSKKYNIDLAGHSPSNVKFDKLLNSDVYQSIEHLGGFSQLKTWDEINSAINRATNNQIYNCATLDWYYTGQLTSDSLRTRSGVEYVPKEIVNSWENKIKEYNEKTSDSEHAEDRLKSKKRFESMLNFLNYIYQQGGLLLVSPDASGTYGIPGYGMHTEMQHYSNATISNRDILKAACYNLSEMMNTQDDWGTIKIGSSTDVVLLNSNPLEKIENTKSIEGLVFKGKYYSKSKLLEKLESISQKIH